MKHATDDTFDEQRQASAPKSNVKQAIITGAQIRAARAFLGWSARALAKKANVPDFTLEWIEGDGKITAKDRNAVNAIQDTLENAGVEFISTIGVQMRPENHPSERL
jgi:hypothetical protein